MLKPVYLFGLVTVLTACGGPLKYDVVSTPKAPGADAHIEADVRNELNQTIVELQITNLAPPGRVEANAASYLAWYRARDSQPWARVGALQYDAETREGRLKASVPETQFELQVTAEASLDSEAPSPNAVVVQRIGG